MSSDCVKRWLSEFKTLTKPEWNSYAFGIRQDQDLILELENVFQGDLSAEAIDPVCHQLFDFYRSMNEELQRFTLELVPALVSRYLAAVVSKRELVSGDCNHDNSEGWCLVTNLLQLFVLLTMDRLYQRLGGIEACLLGIYNLSVVSEDGKPKVSTINLPTLARPSIYHEPPSLASLVLTESALHHYHSDRPSVITVGPWSAEQFINSQNRLKVLTHVMKCYNANITRLSTSSHSTLCRMCSRLAKTGFDNLSEPSAVLPRFSADAGGKMTRRGVSFVEELRVVLNSQFLLELLQSLYYIIFNSGTKSAIDALEDIHFRASYDLFSDVLMITNAIRNSLQQGGIDEVKEKTMGISVAVSPSQVNPIFSKDAITNASFKARKLPEDIEVPEGFPADDSSAQKEKLEGSDNVTSTERSKVMPQKTTKLPIKSIMKKKDEKSKDKNARREPDLATKQLGHLKETSDLQASKSPRHSTSSAVNGDVVGRGSRVIFEQIDGPLSTKTSSESNPFGGFMEERPVFSCGDENHDDAENEIEIEMMDFDNPSTVVFRNSNGSGFKGEKSDIEV